MCGRNDDKMQQHVDATMKHTVGASVMELELAANVKQCVLYKLHLCISQFLSETEPWFNVLWTAHRDIFAQYEPVGCIILLSIYFDN